MDTAVLNRLQANASLVSLVGTRIYPVRPTDDTTLPYLVYTNTGIEDNPTLNNPSSVKRWEYAIDIWTVNEAQNKTIGGYVETQLNGWRDYPTVKGSFRLDQVQTAQPDLVQCHSRQSYAIMA